MPSGSNVVVFAYVVDAPATDPPMAVWSHPASALPVDFALTPDPARGGAAGATPPAAIVIGARLGPGQAPMAQVGDWVAGSRSITPGAKDIQLVLEPPR